MARDGGPDPIGGMTDAHTWSKTIWAPQIPDDFLVNEQGLSKELAIEKRAVDAGEKGLPKKADKTLDETQLKLCERIFEGILMLNQFLAQQLGAAVSAAKDNRVRPMHADGIEEEVQIKLEAAIADQRAELDRLSYDKECRGRELRAFKQRNRLTQPAHYPDSLELPLAIIFGLIVFESLLNGSLLQAVMENGLLGGAFLAFIISMINVGLGIASGLYGWRNVRHVETFNKAIGVALTLLLGMAGIAFNLGVAHFREGAEILVGRDDFQFEMAELTRAAVDHLVANGIFGLASIQAWALLIIGLFIHFYAAKKGWEDLADRYPDYKRYDQKSKTAEAAFEAHLADMRAEARAAVESLERQAEHDARRAQTWLNEIEDLTDRAKQRCAEVGDSEDVWVSTGNRFLKLYRDVNSQVQGEGRAPAYFNSYPTADDYRTRNFGGVRQSGEVQAKAALIARAMDELGRLRAEGEETLKHAKDVARTIHRHVNAAVRNLDKALVQVERESADDARARADREAQIGQSTEGVSHAAAA